MAGRHVSWEFKDGEEISSGRYAVDLLGGGVRAEAWLAWDTSLHSIVVAKLLRPNFVNNERSLRALAREARTLRELQHPAIVRLFDATLVGERPHLVLESLDGPRLSTLIHKYGHLAPEQLVPLGLEVSSALAFMHGKGYVHLDVKPRNIIMSATPKLIDLGMARTARQIERLTVPIGTAAYMAPEQCVVATLPTLGPSADVWGIGVTMYESVTGKMPFPRRKDETDYPQVTFEPRPLDKHVPEVLARTIMSCLEKDPASRPTAPDVAAQLEELLEDARRVARRRLRARYRR